MKPGISMLFFKEKICHSVGRESVVDWKITKQLPYNGQIKLSEEHIDVKWLSYDDAYNLIYYYDQKIALYELNEKLLRNIIIA